MTSQPSVQLNASRVRPIQINSGRVQLLDQRKIPESTEYFDATSLDDMCYAIKEMVVRGAPAIGVAAAIGLALEATRLAQKKISCEQFLTLLLQAKNKLQSTRPTAVNLRWATERIYELARLARGQSPVSIAQKLLLQSEQMIAEDIAINMSIGQQGAKLLEGKLSVLTHCNTGSLATCGWGTALGVIRTAVLNGNNLTVYVDETRPRQQGARLTAWELLQDQITPTLISDTVAGYLMSKHKVDAVIVGADRIAYNGDTANKIGTYSLAVLAHAHNVPFYVAAPLSTIDPQIKSGQEIPIEERAPEEVTTIGGKLICPPGVKVFNPAFDVTPANLITAIITESGVLMPDYQKSIGKALETTEPEP